VRRFCRSFLSAATALSLLLLVAVIVLRARSPFHSDVTGWAGWGDQQAGVWHGWGVHLRGGGLLFYRFSGTLRFDDPTNVAGDDGSDMRPHFFYHGYAARSHAAVRGAGLMQRVGFDSGNFHIWGVKSVDLYALSMPYWSLAVAFALAPLWRAVRAVRRWRALRRLGLCPRCGYDLRATPDRCPECGAIAMAGAVQSNS
jgi:hypothetical protein